MAKIHIEKDGFNIDIEGESLAAVDTTLTKLYRMWSNATRTQNEIESTRSLQIYQARLLERYERRVSDGT